MRTGLQPGVRKEHNELTTLGLRRCPLRHFHKTWFRIVLGQAYPDLIDGFLLLRIFSVAISLVSHVCFNLVFSFNFYVSKIMHS